MWVAVSRAVKPLHPIYVASLYSSPPTRAVFSLQYARQMRAPPGDPGGSDNAGGGGDADGAGGAGGAMHSRGAAGDSILPREADTLVSTKYGS